MSSVKEVAKKLSIKVKAVQRIQKDLIYYEKEYNQQAAKVQKMKDDGKDEYDIKKQEEVLEETNAMMPEARTRLEKAHADLEQAVVGDGERREREREREYNRGSASISRIKTSQ
eukprot:TRINITY_DN15678_c0_g1_i2.p1 TRINITY_DN15678_c0_g1~~TRINITY_DN15678_c0_g1_i2.p1  ORF type:complete len:114 (+),score=29.71 TRINITY_DN15678_c0_g1_i2:194-535(+)